MVLDPPRFLIVGCGAIGGTIAAYLKATGHEVSVLTTNDQIRSAVAESGFRLRGHTCLLRVPTCPLFAAVDDIKQQFDYILLAIQPTAAEETAQAVFPLLNESGSLVCLQNGLCEPRVIAKIGHESRVLGAVVTFGASMPEPGLFDRTSSGGFVIGRWGEGADDAAKRLSRAMSVIGPSEVTERLAGMRWSKLAINCVVSTLGTIGGEHLGALLRRRSVRHMALRLLAEVAMVAQAEGVRLEKLSGLFDVERIARRPSHDVDARGVALALRHALLLFVGMRYRRLRSSMLANIERGRPPPVDYLNGEVVARAESHGLQVPLNEKAQRLVWAIARGERAPGPQALAELATS